MNVPSVSRQSLIGSITSLVAREIVVIQSSFCAPSSVPEPISESVFFGKMISIFLRIVSCVLFIACSHSTPIKELNTGRPSNQLEEFIDGEIVCTGHLLEENFEDNLAAAAESK